MTARRLLVLCLLFAACVKRAEVVPEALAEEFKPTGGIQYQDTGAQFDGARVVGPLINVSRRTDGSWAGMLHGQVMDVSVTPERATGVNFTMTVKPGENGGVLYVGQWQGNTMRFQIDNNEAVVRTGVRSMNLQKKGTGSYGPMGELTMTGEAAQATPPWPQAALALIATFGTTTHRR